MWPSYDLHRGKRWQASWGRLICGPVSTWAQWYPNWCSGRGNYECTFCPWLRPTSPSGVQTQPSPSSLAPLSYCSPFFPVWCHKDPSCRERNPVWVPWPSSSRPGYHPGSWFVTRMSSFYTSHTHYRPVPLCPSSSSMGDRRQGMDGLLHENRGSPFAAALISIFLASRPLLDGWRSPLPAANEHRASSGWSCNSDNQQAQDL